MLVSASGLGLVARGSGWIGGEGKGRGLGARGMEGREGGWRAEVLIPAWDRMKTGIEIEKRGDGAREKMGGGVGWGYNS